MATRTTPNPLDAYVTTKPGNWPADFKVPPVPKLRDALSGNTLIDAASSFDERFEQWRKDHEQAISERMRLAAPTATTTAAPAAVAPTSAPSASPSLSSGVSSVNGKSGAVILTSDDVPAGSTNLYLTPDAWLALFDAIGFHSNYIATGQSIHIPALRNLVMTGPLTIDGSLTVDGYMAIV